MESVHGPRNAVMLIRLRHGDAMKAVLRARRTSTTATTTPTRRSAPTSAARRPSTSSRPPDPVPLPPVAVRCTPLGQAGLRSRGPGPARAAHQRRQGRLPVREG
jgi:hypothetical protein